MQIINIEDKKWTVGLEWETLPGEDSFKQEAKSVAERLTSNYGVVIEYDGKFGIGLSKTAKPKIPSATLLLALANKKMLEGENSHANYYSDWIVVNEVGEDRYWISIIRKGIPSPDSDKILDITKVNEVIEECLMNDSYTIYTRVPEIHAMFSGRKLELESVSINKLTEGVTIPKDIFFRKLRGIPPEVMYMGIAGLACVGLLIVGMKVWDGLQLKQKQAALIKQQQEQAQKAKAEYDLKVKQYEEQIKKNKEEALNKIANSIKIVPIGVLRNWYNVVGNIETGTHGWKLTKVECYINPVTNNLELPTSACDIQFKRSGLSSTRMLLQDYPDAVVKGDQAVVSKVIELHPEDIINGDLSELDKLPTAKNWGFDMISQLQILKIANIDHEIKASKTITYKIPPKPLKPEEIKAGKKPSGETQASTGFAKGDLNITNDNYELVKEIADNVDFKGVAIQKVTFEPKDLGEIKWMLHMDYFVKEDSTGGITGSNSSSLSNSPLGTTNNQEIKK